MGLLKDRQVNQKKMGLPWEDAKWLTPGGRASGREREFAGPEARGFSETWGAKREVDCKMRQWGLEVIRSREDTGFHISLVSVCTGEVFGLG